MKLACKSIMMITAMAMLVGAPRCAAQEPGIRAEAVRMVEQANRVSMSPNLPNLERTDTFRVFGDSGVTEGTFTRVVVQGTGRRDEVSYGGYHTVEVWTERKLSAVRSHQLAPPEVQDLFELTPIHLLLFDGSDVIRAITAKSGSGGPERCIEFETVQGERRESNEFCIDNARGTFASMKVGSNLLEYGEYFPFAGAWMPGKIRYSVGGVRKMEISQSMRELKDATANVLEAPPGAALYEMCTTFRRAIGEAMPQPPAGHGAGNVDVEVRGIVGVDGKIQDAVVQDSEGRKDLEAEALAIIARWTFSPQMCNGAPNQQEASFVLHFLGR